ncbi:hypothetical protein SALBM311S_00644 [Streptomyces alboniger]
MSGPVSSRRRDQSLRGAERLLMPGALGWSPGAQLGVRLEAGHVQVSDCQESQLLAQGGHSRGVRCGRTSRIAPRHSPTALVLGGRTGPAGVCPVVRGRAGAAAAGVARRPSVEWYAGVEGCPRMSPYEVEAKLLGGCYRSLPCHGPGGRITGAVHCDARRDAGAGRRRGATAACGGAPRGAEDRTEGWVLDWSGRRVRTRQRRPGLSECAAGDYGRFGYAGGGETS